MDIRSEYIWMDGSYVPYDDARIHILNHSLHYGSAVFEGIRFYETERGPAIFRLDEHIDRLFLSADAVGMRMPFSKADVRDAAIGIVAKNGFREGYIRPIIFYGERMGLYPDVSSVHVAIACWPWGKYLDHDVVTVRISPLIRIHPESSVMEAKIAGNYVNSVMASIEARKAGFDEALFLDFAGHIAEGPGENIFFVKDKELFTPKSGSILPGITRDTVMKLAEDVGYEITETDLRPEDLARFDEAFFVGTAVEVHPIGRIDDIEYETREGGVTARLRDRYLDVVRGRDDRHVDWLTVCGSSMLTKT